MVTGLLLDTEKTRSDRLWCKHARRTAGLLRARVSSDSYDAWRVRQLVRKQMLRFAASTPMGGVPAGGFAGLKRCG